MFTVKQPPGTPFSFRKRLQWRHSGTQLGGDGDGVCVSLCVYIRVCVCVCVCVDVDGFARFVVFVMIETNHNTSGETDRGSPERQMMNQ